MDNLEPITRNEMFLNGDDLEPITREEMILAGADLEPITRHEWFLKKYRGGGGGGGYDLVNVPNLPADIASFTDGTDLPMASLKVAVTPYQDLSHGDPSPENICPIIGWDEAVVTRCGKNICNIADGNITTSITIGEITLKAGTYTFSLEAYRQDGGRASFRVMNGDTIIVQTEEVEGATTYKPLSATFTLAEETTVKINGQFFANYSTLYYKNVMIEKGTTATTYSPYNGATYTIDLNGTRYGGVVDATDGTFLDMIDHIASYNGEELPPAWISDRDVYAVGTTPTIGAEVVYPRATPITVQLSPQPVKSLEGVNKIMANCGQITEGKYFKKA